MLDKVDRRVGVAPEAIEAVRRASVHPEETKRFPCLCPSCGRGGWLSLPEVVAGCEPCRADGDDGLWWVLESESPEEPFWVPDIEWHDLPELPDAPEDPWYDPETFEIRRPHPPFVVEYGDEIVITHDGVEVGRGPGVPGYLEAEEEFRRQLHEHYGHHLFSVQAKTCRERDPLPPGEWSETTVEGIGADVWCRLRWILEGWSPGEFDAFLEDLGVECRFTDVFMEYYEKYRGWAGISGGLRTIEWDMLASVAMAAFPEYDCFPDLADDLNTYAATVRAEWATPGQDVVILTDEQEITLAAQSYLEAEEAARPLRALGLYYLCKDYEGWL